MLRILYHKTVNQAPQRYSLNALVSKMEAEHARVCRQILEDYKETIFSIPGSHVKHHAWEGGYIDHVEETMNIVLTLYAALDACRPLPFDLSEALFCAFLHDFDKVQRYTISEGILKSQGGYSGHYIKKTKTILKEKYDYILTTNEYNALKYAHGEGDDYHPTDRIMQPLATLVHCSDTISARIWFDKGHNHSQWH